MERYDLDITWDAAPAFACMINTEISSQLIRPLGRDLNSGPPECEAGVLPNQ
jgi:hypothetical protein